MDEYKIYYIIKINKYVSEQKETVIMAKSIQHATNVFNKQPSNHKRIITNIYKG